MNLTQPVHFADPTTCTTCRVRGVLVEELKIRVCPECFEEWPEVIAMEFAEIKSRPHPGSHRLKVLRHLRATRDVGLIEAKNMVVGRRGHTPTVNAR